MRNDALIALRGIKYYNSPYTLRSSTSPMVSRFINKINKFTQLVICVCYRYLEISDNREDRKKKRIVYTTEVHIGRNTIHTTSC